MKNKRNCTINDFFVCTFFEAQSCIANGFYSCEYSFVSCYLFMLFICHYDTFAPFDFGLIK